ncbi:MAG: hypothetical protein JST21_12990, partial [Bacteroidetes bacterium]|nr:hypothetical protein [Bacteroidota bacterium]
MKHILFLALALLIFKSAFNQSGTIDSSFGDDGFVSSNRFGIMYAISQQEDKKILIAGSYEIMQGAAIACYNIDGTLDSSFGTNGFAIANNPVRVTYDMALLQDGRILTCGSFVDESFKSKSFVTRFKPDGKPDSTFGVNGTCVVPLFNMFCGYTEIALEPDGSIIIGGAGYDNPNVLDSVFSVISHLSADGYFDYNFGNGGYVLNLTAVNMKDLAIQPDGKIVTAGYDFAGGFQQQDFVFSRYNADGTLDESFGNNGNIVMDGTGGEDVPGKIIIQQDGKIVIGGFSGGDTYYMSALRFNADGSLDNSFGTNGKTFISFNKKISKAYDMAMQPDGKFILAGSVNDQGILTFGFCRINHNGSLDSSFGNNGTEISEFKGNEEAYSVALQSDGKILLGGYNYNVKKDYQTYLLARYNNDLTKKQIIFAKIRRWWQHHNGIMWDNVPGVKNYTIQRSGDGAHWSTVYKTKGNTNIHSSINNSQFTINNS